ncbi:hypothetical protein [Amaricoccus solimangrovi]|uniref:Uncharacterized protein n=1 Tax=Amaricoccus solimangrovi TaxID=2589815 RepID=A0A501WVL7_9RHOB|nr:hypothetical protein [Amaricoccus solimangrovi]TPE49926.1 hypothetical protein FJM51_13260 [Amaricoccus solimangrovi]
MHALARRAARLILSLLLLVSLGLAAWNAWTLAASPVGAMLVARSETEIAARLERLLAREVTPEALDRRLTAHLDASPRDWAAIDALSRLAEEQGVAPSPEVAARLSAADAEDRSAMARTRDCLACAWDPARCDLSAIALCQVAVALIPFGDAVSVARESGHLVAGAEVDEIDLALSTVGLAATLAVPLTAGASTLVDAGAGVMRTAYRMGALSEPVVATLRRGARTGIDWGRVSKLRPGRGFGDELAAAIRPGALRPATAFLEDAGGLVKSAGTRDAIFMLGKARRAEDAKVLAATAKPLGPRAAGTVEWAGMRHLGRLTLRYADEVWYAAASALSAAAALAGLLLATLKSLTLRALRRLAREPRLARE